MSACVTSARSLPGKKQRDYRKNSSSRYFEGSFRGDADSLETRKGYELSLKESFTYTERGGREALLLVFIRCVEHSAVFSFVFVFVYFSCVHSVLGCYTKKYSGGGTKVMLLTCFWEGTQAVPLVRASF